jgi:hypothetical protein
MPPGFMSKAFGLTNPMKLYPHIHVDLASSFQPGLFTAPGLATFGALASERNVILPPNSSFVATCPLQFVNGGLMLAATCVSGNLTVVEFRAVGNELALNFTLYDREGGTYKKGAEWPRLMTPLEMEPEYRELVKRLRVNASIYLVDRGGQGAGGGRAILGSPRLLYSLMMEHTALVVDNKTLIVIVTFRDVENEQGDKRNRN